jgi:uncharacterized protein (DUF2141 family)
MRFCFCRFATETHKKHLKTEKMQVKMQVRTFVYYGKHHWECNKLYSIRKLCYKIAGDDLCLSFIAV